MIALTRGIRKALFMAACVTLATSMPCHAERHSYCVSSMHALAPKSLFQEKQGEKLIEIFKEAGLLPQNKANKDLIEEIKNILLPAPQTLPSPEELETIILPSYFCGPFLNENVRNLPELENNLKYMKGIFVREMEKATRFGTVDSSRQEELVNRFNNVLIALTLFEEEPGQRYFDKLTNLENTKVALRLTKFVIFGNPDAEVNEVTAEKVASQANAITREAARESIFMRTLGDLVSAPTRNEKAHHLSRALRMAIYASAPNIWFSNPEVQQDPHGAMVRTRQLFENALELSFAIDSTQEFVDEVLLSRGPLKVAYFVDDNGDLTYHLHLIKTYLSINPLLQVTIIPKKGRHAIDASYQDVMRELATEDHLGLKEMLGKRLRVLDEGPEYPGVNLRQISKAMLEVLQDADVVVGLGQSVLESLNGITKPAYHQSYVDAMVQRVVTGLPKGAMYFTRVPGGQKYFDDYTAKAYRRINGEPAAGLTLADSTGFTLRERLRARIKSMLDVLMCKDAPRVLLLGGPTASGKSTMLGDLTKLDEHLTPFDLDRFMVSISQGEVPDHLIQDDGTINLDHPDFYRWDKIRLSLENLLTTGQAEIPGLFNFEQRRRRDNTNERETIRLDPKNGVLVIEAIHALDDKIMQVTENTARCKVAMSAPELMRVARRIVRDARERGKKPLWDLTYWIKVLRESEREFVSPAVRQNDVVRLNTHERNEWGNLRDALLPLLQEAENELNAGFRAQRISAQIYADVNDLITRLRIMAAGKNFFSADLAQVITTRVNDLTSSRLRDNLRRAFDMGQVMWHSQYEDWTKQETDRKKQLVAGVFVLRKINGAWHFLLAQRSPERAKDKQGFFSAPVGGVNKKQDPTIEHPDQIRSLLRAGILSPEDLDPSGVRESTAGAAVRELREEAGIKASITDLCGRVDQFRGNHEGMLVNFMIYVDDSQDPRVELNEELINPIWLPLQLILSCPPEAVGIRAEEYLQETIPGCQLMHGLKTSGLRNLHYLLRELIVTDERELIGNIPLPAQSITDIRLDRPVEHAL